MGGEGMARARPESSAMAKSFPWKEKENKRREEERKEMNALRKKFGAL